MSLATLIVRAGLRIDFKQVLRRALYCAKDVRSQMAEMLQYSPGHQARAPGSLPLPLAALSSRVLVMLKRQRAAGKWCATSRAQVVILW